MGLRWSKFREAIAKHGRPAARIPCPVLPQPQVMRTFKPSRQEPMVGGARHYGPSPMPPATPGEIELYSHFRQHLGPRYEVAGLRVQFHYNQTPGIHFQ